MTRKRRPRQAAVTVVTPATVPDTSTTTPWGWTP